MDTYQENHTASNFHNIVTFVLSKESSFPFSAKYQSHIQVLKKTSTPTGIGGIMIIAQDTKAFGNVRIKQRV